MNHDATLIFPHQLFEEHPALDHNRRVYLVEHDRFFTDFSFHKQKLVLHRATLRMYYDFLMKQQYTVTYIEYRESAKIIETIVQSGIKHIHLADVTDYPLMQQLKKAALATRVELQVYETTQFLTEANWIEQEYKGKDRFFQHSFYIAQRKRLQILVDNGKPVGGKWTFDTENRHKLDPDLKIPSLTTFKQNDYVQEAISYILHHFPDNPGSLNHFSYPTTFNQARQWLMQFLQTRFRYFGPYQDAMDTKNHVLFHSVLSPILNIGLLTPQYILNETLAYASIHKIQLNSVEGFIRQIIGWREYIRAIYLLKGETQRTSNYFNHTHQLDTAWWHAATGIDPLDTVITEVLNTGYAHHIERLMVLGNFMLLTQTAPDEAYHWFMELFIDSYDWVMVPNVYGMSQYADGGLMSTKPYISSSRYIMSMSNYKRGSWANIWDSLYWNFLAKHHRILKKNPRMNLVLKSLSHLKDETIELHKKTAAKFIGISNVYHK